MWCGILYFFLCSGIHSDAVLAHAGTDRHTRVHSINSIVRRLHMCLSMIPCICPLNYVDGSPRQVGVRGVLMFSSSHAMCMSGGTHTAEWPKDEQHERDRWYTMRSFVINALMECWLLHMWATNRVAHYDSLRFEPWLASPYQSVLLVLSLWFCFPFPAFFFMLNAYGLV